MRKTGKRRLFRGGSVGKKRRKKKEEVQSQELMSRYGHSEIAFPSGCPEGRPGGWRLFVVCLLVFVCAFTVYANTLKGDFVWDDEYLILNNSQIKSFKHLPNVFKTWVGYGSENINNFYRPIQEISNMVDHFFWGRQPMGFHLTNIVLHALVCALAALFLYRLSGSLAASFAGGIFYAVHPVHTEAVAYIAGRADSLYSLFFLAAMILFVKYAEAKRNGTKTGMGTYIISAAFFAVSLLSKEIAIVLPLLVFIYVLYFGRNKEGRILPSLRWVWVPYALIAVVYAWLRITVLSFSDVAPQSVFGRIPLVFRLITFFRTVIIYFKLMLFPVDLHMERNISISNTLLDLEAAGAVAFILFLAWIAWKTFRKNRLISFGVVWFFANLLPVSNIIPINSFLAEHWIYMASVGIVLIVGLGIAEVYDRYLKNRMFLKISFTSLMVLWAGLYAAGTVQRNDDWKDEITFFNSTLKYHPKNARLYLNLGNTYYEKGEIEKAIEQYRKSIEMNQNYAVAYGNIGSAYLNKGDRERAEEYLVKAIELRKEYPIAHYNLGIIYLQKGRIREAMEELEVSTEQLPQFYQAWNMLGRVRLKAGDVVGARNAFERSVAILPGQKEIKDILDRTKERN